MTGLRWLAVAIGLAGVFCVSIAAGAYVGHDLADALGGKTLRVRYPQEDAFGVCPID